MVAIKGRMAQSRSEEKGQSGDKSSIRERIAAPIQRRLPPAQEQGLDDDSWPGERWEMKSRRVAAASWLYHPGLILFSLHEHRRTGHRVTGVLSLLLARDGLAGCAALMGVSPRRLAGLAAATDLVAMTRLRSLLPASDFLHDRSLSQIGMGPAWSVALNDPKIKMRATVVLPLAVQAAMLWLWGIRGRDAVLYLAREGLWSFATLGSVRHLRRQLLRSLREQRSAALKLAHEHGEQTRLATDAQVWLYQHHGHLDVFTTVRHLAESLSEVEGDAYDQIAKSAHGYELHLRNLKLEDRPTLSAQLERLITARDASGYETTWEGNLIPPATRVTPESAEALEQVIESILAAAPNQLRIITMAGDGHVTLSLQGRLPDLAQFHLFNSAQTADGVKLVGTLPCG